MHKNEGKEKTCVAKSSIDKSEREFLILAFAVRNAWPDPVLGQLCTVHYGKAHH